MTNKKTTADFSGQLKLLYGQVEQFSDVDTSLVDLLTVWDAKKQLDRIKSVAARLRQDKPEDEIVCGQAVELFVNVYLGIEAKHPAKRVIASCLQSLPCRVHPRIEDEICQQIRDHVFSVDTSKITSPELRHPVNIIAGLLDNFRIGESCVQKMALEVLSLMASSLEMFLKNYSTDLPPVENNEAMHHCHVTLQTTNKMLQKCAAVFDWVLQDQVQRTRLEDLARRVLTCSNQLLRIDNFLLDCCCTAGMSLGLFVSLIQKTSAANLILRCVFPRVLKKSQPAVPTWLELSGCCKLSDRDLSLTSHLCVCHGLVGVLDDGLLVREYETGKCLLMDVFLDELLKFTRADLESSGKLLVAKALVAWSCRACSVLESSARGGYSIDSFLGPGPVVQKLLSYVWMTWEEPIDALRLNSRQIFDNAVRLHLLASKADPREDDFLQALVTSLLDISWSTKGKYGPLSCLVDHVGANQILRSHPGLPDNILGALQEHALACYASELYEKLCRTQLCEVGGAADGTWAAHWVEPVLRVLCSNHSMHRLNVLEYVLPRLLKVNKDALSHMIHSLTNGQAGICGSKLGALVMCLRRARAMGLLQETAPPSDGTLMFGLIPSSLLRQALSSHSEQVRLDAFALLCESNKTSQLIQPCEFELLQFFVRLNMNNQSPAFRQSVTSNLKKLFARMAESQAAVRRVKIRSGDTAGAGHYKEFCHWLLLHLFDNLFPGASFARTTTTLAVLSLLITTLTTQVSEAEGPLIDLAGFVTPHHVRTLVECMTDTFEENKAQALKIITLLPHTVFSDSKNGWLSELLEVALKLSVSTKPQDCGTAAYLLRLVVAQEESTDLIQSLLYKQTEDPMVISGVKMPIKNCGESSKFYVEENVFGVMKILLRSLQGQLAVAKANLLQAAAAGPMYPTIHCIRYLLSDFSLSSVKDETKWRNLLSELISSCCEVARVVSPVVNNSSPEGNIPVEAIKDPGLKLESVLCQSSHEGGTPAVGEAPSEVTVALMPEYLVVCCWRSVKEVSLLLGELALISPIIDPAAGEDNTTANGLLTFQQIVCIGEYFISQLLEAKHRGAFELAYAGFVTMMGMLWRNRLGAVRQLPVSWLGQVMSDIQSEDGMSKLCATRRSAGVPFYIQAVLVTEPVVSGKRYFKQTMATLVELALCPCAGTDSQVHALNILRALYRDARLGKDVSLYVADGVKAAVIGFTSPDWAVRNSSTLLFSALMTRIFGVKRSKDESAMSKKNCLTGRVFFHRYPPLYPFLLAQLEEATRHIGVPGPLRLHPGLYPVLMLLGRLMPSVLEGGDTSLSLAAFIPHIIRCSSSPVLKTRLMAARALQPLVFKDQVTSVLDGLLQQLPTIPGGHMTQSHIHGILLQIRELLMSVEQLPSSLRQSATDSAHTRLLRSAWLLTRSNPCLVTRQAMLETVQRTLHILPCASSGLQTLMADCLEAETASSSCYSPHTPALAEFMTSVAYSYLHNSAATSSSMTHFNGNIVMLLNSEFYEVRSVALEHLLAGFGTSREENGVCKQLEVLTCREDKTEVQSESALDRKLINMVLGEEWCSECLVKLFQVCALQPSLRRMLELEADLLIKVVAKVVPMATESKNLDLKGSAISFVGSILVLIYRMAKAKPMESLESGLLQSCVCLLRDCSQTEDGEQVKMAVIQVLVTNAEPLLLDPDRVLGPLTLTLWRVVYDLLQDDDLEVKDTMACVLPYVEKRVSDPVEPVLALDVLIGTMLRVHMGCLPLHCLQLLVSLMVNQDNTQQIAEERLFDKGEMNTYKEEITLARLAAQHLSQILTTMGTSDGCHITSPSSLPLDQTQCSSYRTTDSEPSKLDEATGASRTTTCGVALEMSPTVFDNPLQKVSSKCSENLRDVDSVSMINTTVKDLSSQLEDLLENSNGFTLGETFLNTSEYQETVSQISRLVTALKCLQSSGQCKSLSAVDQLLRKTLQAMNPDSCNNLMARQLFVES